MSFISQGKVIPKIEEYLGFKDQNYQGKHLGFCRGLSTVWSYFCAVDREAIFWDYLEKFLKLDMATILKERDLNDFIISITLMQEQDLYAGSDVLKRLLGSISSKEFLFKKITHTFSYNFSKNNELYDFFTLLISQLTQVETYLDDKLILLKNVNHMCALSYKKNRGFLFYDPSCVKYQCHNVKSLCEVIYKALGNSLLDHCSLIISIDRVFVDPTSTNDDIYYPDMKEIIERFFNNRVEKLVNSDAASVRDFKIWLLYAVQVSLPQTVAVIEKLLWQNNLLEYKNNCMDCLPKYANKKTNDWWIILTYFMSPQLIFDMKKIATAIEKNVRMQNIEMLEKALKDNPEEINKISVHYEATLLMQAAYLNKYKAAEILLKYGAKIKGNYKFEDALLYAILGQNLELCILLLQHGADPNINVRDWPLLYVAFRIERLDLCKVLLEYKADPNVRFSSDVLFESVIHAENVEFCKLLLDHRADPNYKTNEEFTLFHHVVCEYKEWTPEQNDIFQLLLQHGADPNLTDSDGNTALHLAIKNNNWQAFKMLLEFGAFPNERNYLGFTPFLLAIDLEKVVFVEHFLLSPYKINRVNFNDITSEGDSVLHIAVRNKNEYFCELLLTAGVTINMRNSSGHTPVHLAVKNNDPKILLLLLVSGGDPCLLDNEYINPLNMAINNNNNLICNILLKFGSKFIQKSRANKSWLIKAIELSNEYICKLLLDYGVKPEGTSIWSRSPLYIAYKINNNKIFNLLLEKGADPNTRDDLKLPLLYSCVADQKEFFYQALFKYGVDPNLTDGNDKRLLELAIENRQFEVCKILLDHGADPMLIDNNVITALNKFIDSNNIKIVEAICIYFKNKPILQDGNPLIKEVVEKYAFKLLNYLLDYDFDLNLAGLENKTPLYVAVDRENLTLCTLLLEKGADPNVSFISFLKRNSVLQVAIEHGNMELVKLLLKHGAKLLDPDYYYPILHNLVLCKLLLKHSFIQKSEDCINDKLLFTEAVKASNFKVCNLFFQYDYDLNIKNERGRSALYTVVKDNKYLGCEFLLKNGANTEKIDNYGVTALHVAAVRGYYRLVKLLLKHGANVNASTNKGLTPLHLAAYVGYQGICKLLLTHNADINARDNNKSTPMMIAYYYGNLDVVKCLIKNNAKLSDIVELDTIIPEVEKSCENIATQRLLLARKIKMFNNIELVQHYYDCFQYKPEEILQQTIMGMNLTQKRDQLWKLLQAAIIYGRIDVCQNILEQNLIEKDHLKEQAKTLFKEAVIYNRVEVVKLMINHGLPYNNDNDGLLYNALLYNRANIYNLFVADLNHGYLFSAISKGDEEVCEILLNYLTDFTITHDTGHTLLQWAIIERKYQICKLLLKSGADPNFCKNGYPPIHLVVFCRDLVFIELLLAYKANINAVDLNGFSVLFKVTESIIWRPAKEICKKLLVYGADPNQLDEEGGSPLINAIVTKDEEVCSLLLKHGADPNFKYLFTIPIYLAIKGNLFEICKLLIQYGAIIDFSKPEANDLIILAIEKGDTKFFNELLNLADPQYKSQEIIDNYLKIAINKNKLAVAKFLILYFNANVNAIINQTPLLHTAVKNNVKQIITLLLKNNVDLNIKDGNKRTALHIAAINGLDNIARLLIKYNAKLNILDNAGYTPFGLATLHGRVDLCKLLIKSCANVNLCGKNMYEPYVISLLYNYEEITQLLISHKKTTSTVVEISKSNFPYQDNIFGNREICFQILSLYYRYKQLAHTNTVYAQDVLQEIIKVLLQWEFDRKNDHDLTALHVAVYYELQEVVKFLLNSGYSANAMSEKYDTPLILAIKYFRHGSLQILLEYDADVHFCLKDLDTPLHIAITVNNLTAIKLLSARGADFECRNIFNITPIMLAKKYRLNLDK